MPDDPPHQFEPVAKNARAGIAFRKWVKRSRQLVSQLTVGGEERRWSVFTRRAQSGAPVVVRSRVSGRDLYDFAAANIVARLRCIPHDYQVDAGKMPMNTGVFDEYEDALIAQLESNAAEVFEIAVVTGDGCRDLFFATAARDPLRLAVGQIRADRPFTLKIGWIEGPKDVLLKSLCP